jgi:hypothetical protein
MTTSQNRGPFGLTTEQESELQGLIDAAEIAYEKRTLDANFEDNEAVEAAEDHIFAFVNNHLQLRDTEITLLKKKIEQLESQLEGHGLHSDAPKTMQFRDPFGVSDDTIMSDIDDYETAYESHVAELERTSLANPGGIDHSDYLAAMGIDEGPTEKELAEDEAITAELNAYQPTEEEMRIQEESDARYDEDAISRAEHTASAYDDGATQDQFDQKYNPANDLAFYRGYFANRPSQGYRKSVDDHTESED